MKRAGLIGLVLVMGAVFALAAAPSVTFVLSKDAINPGESVSVKFNVPLPKEGERYWITVISAGSADSEWGAWKYVDVGIKEVAVEGPTAPGSYEIRLHDRYPDLNYHVVFRKPLTVKSAAPAPAPAPASAGITFTLASAVIPAGGKPKVTFNQPLPKEGERYWITVINQGQPDSEWGQWQYVDVGASSLELTAVAAAGSYEVRLHDRYPDLGYHVVYRLPLTVK